MLRKQETELDFRRLAVREILNLCSFEMTSHERIFTSLWTTSGSQITDLNDVPFDCQMLIVSELPMIEEKSNFLKPRREHSVNESFDM